MFFFPFSPNGANDGNGEEKHPTVSTTLSPPSPSPSTPSRASGRRKRKASPDTVDTQIPDWLKPQETNQVADGIRKFVPFFVGVEALTNMFNIPGRKENEETRQRIRLAGDVVYENSEAIKQFDSDISSFSRLFANKIDFLNSKGRETADLVQQAQLSIQHLYDKAGSVADVQNSRLDHISHIDDTFIGKILPPVVDYERAVQNTAFNVHKFIDGVKQLTKGYASPFLIPESYMSDMLEHVNTVFLRIPKNSALTLPSPSVSYYYGLKTVKYAHTYKNKSAPQDGTVLYVTLKIPMFNVDGLLPVYRIDTYPVPVTAGLETGKNTNDLDFTKLANMPDFIAVSNDLNHYVEMTKELFLTCRGETQSKKCGAGMSVLRKANPGKFTCAYSLFTERDQDAKEECHFVLTSERVLGSAIQLSSDNTFLMHASQRILNGRQGDEWRLSCKSSSVSPTSVLKVCPMCRVKIPCYCSVTGNDFFLPERFTGCLDVESSGHDTQTLDPPATYLYHLNTIMLKMMFPESDAATYTSYATRDTTLTDVPFSFPKFSYSVEDDLVARSDYGDKTSRNLNKAVARELANLSSYVTKEDAALARARDMSDVTVDRAGSISAAFLDLAGAFFGKYSVYLVLLLTPNFFMFITMVLVLPRAISQLVVDLVNLRKRKQMEYSITNTYNMFLFEQKI